MFLISFESEDSLPAKRNQDLLDHSGTSAIFVEISRGSTKSLAGLLQERNPTCGLAKVAKVVVP